MTGPRRDAPPLPHDDAGAALTAPQAGLVRLSAAIAAGGSEDVAAQARAALEAGLTPERIYETVLQSYLFVGFPRAIEAFFAAAPVLAERGAGPPAPDADPERWRREGEALCRRVYGRNYEKLLRTMHDLSPDLADSMILEGYGKTLSRPGLDAMEREYGVVAILTATRMWRQLRSHAIGAVNVGGSRRAVQEAIGLCAPWCGAAVVGEALAVTGLA
jgi:4-carboxymuconolactone decarboxylase